MVYAFPGAGALDYDLCQYPGSRLQFRGPMRLLDRPYVAVLGGTETYGKYVPDPYPDLAQDLLGLPMVNLANVNAGPELYLHDHGLLALISRAEAVVVQVAGAHAGSNRYFTVHPRRNDRLLRISSDLRAAFPRVDFTEFNFTRHMLQSLYRASPLHFQTVAAEMRRAWAQRMRDLFAALPPRRVLLWMADVQPPAALPEGPGPDPLLIDRAMIDAVRPFVSTYVEAVPTPVARAEEMGGKVFPPQDAAIAALVPGQAFHREVAIRVTDAVEATLAR